ACGEDEVIQEGVIRGGNDDDLPGCDDEETDDADAPRQEKHEDKGQFHEERCPNGKGMEPVWKMLHIPADPGGERAILVVLVHGGEVAPFGIATEELNEAGFKVDTKPFPQNEELAGARRGGGCTEAGPEAARREEERNEAGFEQHAIGLIVGEVLSCRDE